MRAGVVVDASSAGWPVRGSLPRRHGPPMIRKDEDVRRILVVGGTGPTGHPLLEGLLARGHDVTVFHTGRHEVAGAPDVPHVHGDPFTGPGIAAALGNRSFDTVIATYGRVRLLAGHFDRRCDHFLAIGGTPVYRGYINPGEMFPYGVRLPVRETEHPLVAADAPRFAGYNAGPIRATEDFVFELAAGGAFGATYLRYPTIYGPRNPYAWEWNVVRRVLDGRRRMILSDGGHGIHSRAAARNAAEAVALAADRPDVAKDKAYNVADDELLTFRQWAQLVARAASSDLEIVSLPGELASPGSAVSAYGGNESACCIVDTSRLRNDLGYRDVVSIRDGLAETVRWMLENEPEMRRAGTTDPFDYAAEDALLGAYHHAMRGLAPYTAPFRSRIGRMAVPQTAKGSEG